MREQRGHDVQRCVFLYGYVSFIWSGIYTVSFGVCKINYLLSVTPADFTASRAGLVGNLLEKCMRSILGGALDSEVFKKIQLPMKTNPEHLHIGIRLSSACDTAASSVLPSASACNKLVEMAITGSAVKGIGRHSFAKNAYDAWAQQCEEEEVLPLQAFDVDRPPKQKFLGALVHKKKAKNVLQGSSRMRIFRANMSLPEAKTWLHCRPCKPLRTLINASQFTTCFRI